MKRALTIAVAGAALAAMLSLVAAGAPKREPVTEAAAPSAYEIIATVRAIGLVPLSEPVRRGPYYVLRATNPRGVEMRVVADAQFGDILSVAPAHPLNTADAPHYERGARIIHVPQSGEREDRSNVNERDEPAASNDDAAEKIAPPAPRRATPRPRSDAPLPPPPGPRRTVLSAPPPPAEGRSPIRPTPRFNSKIDPAERFGAPGDLTITPSTPPPGYTPPAALPRDN